MMSILKKSIWALFLVAAASAQILAQDTVAPPLVKGGIYDRPYLLRPSSRIAIGGYAETMVRSEWEEGIHENVSFEARRFNIFLFSAIASGIKLTSELEFEHGTEGIKLETALIDVEFAEWLNLRGGILLSPLGKFNLAHDSPRNELTDRPLVSTRIIPSTLSEAGFGFFGSFYPHEQHRLTYELYAVNGFNDGIILNGDGTSIPDGRPRAFEEDNNGSPAFVGRAAWISDSGLELGVSVHTGVYNTYKREGLDVDARRRLTILAVDGELQLGDLMVQGEFANAHVEIPSSLIGLFAQSQRGMYAQATYRALESLLPTFPQSTLSFSIRFDAIDLDTDVKGDNAIRLSVGANLKLVSDTAIKLDYQQDWMYDGVNNLTRAAAIQFGIATYF